MELLLPLAAAVLVGTGVFLVLARALIRVILGLSLISYGVNLSILLVGGMREGAPPLLDIPGPYVDPLPQALILTAIVIGFGTTALLLVLSIRAYQATGTDEVQELTEKPDPPVLIEPYADPERPSISPERGPAEDTDDDTEDSAARKKSAETSAKKVKTDAEVKPKKADVKKSGAKKTGARKARPKKTEPKKADAKKARQAGTKKTTTKKPKAKKPDVKKAEVKPKKVAVKKPRPKKPTATKTNPKKEMPDSLTNSTPSAKDKATLSSEPETVSETAKTEDNS